MENGHNQQRTMFCGLPRIDHDSMISKMIAVNIAFFVQGQKRSRRSWRRWQESATRGEFRQQSGVWTPLRGPCWSFCSASMEGSTDTKQVDGLKCTLLFINHIYIYAWMILYYDIGWYCMILYMIYKHIYIICYIMFICQYWSPILEEIKPRSISTSCGPRKAPFHRHVTLQRTSSRP